MINTLSANATWSKRTKESKLSLVFAGSLERSSSRCFSRSATGKSFGQFGLLESEKRFSQSRSDSSPAPSGGLLEDAAMLKRFVSFSAAPSEVQPRKRRPTHSKAKTQFFDSRASAWLEEACRNFSAIPSSSAGSIESRMVFHESDGTWVMIVSATTRGGTCMKR